jgi:hypothetical protein
MFWKLFQMYPWSLITTVALPVVTGFVAVIGGIVWSQAGYENLKHQFAEDERARRIEENVNAIHQDNTTLQSTLALLNSYNDKLLAAGKRDEVLVALINRRLIPLSQVGQYVV